MMFRRRDPYILAISILLTAIVVPVLALLDVVPPIFMAIAPFTGSLASSILVSKEPPEALQQVSTTY